jgi:hypothetical protein
VSLGANLSTGQLVLTTQANITVGAGSYAGVGVQVVGQGSRGPGIPAGLSRQQSAYAEANAGWGAGYGVSGSVAEGALNVGGTLSPKWGAGYGAMAGVGASTAVTLATPELWCR